MADAWGHSWCIIWGPPGTGKTTTVGRQVAECLADEGERILVVSTTNKSTDESALSIGRAIRICEVSRLESSEVLRIGKGAHVEKYQAEGLEDLLRGSETDLLRQIGSLLNEIDANQEPERRAICRKHIQQLKKAMKDASFNAFASGAARAVVATAFKAVALLNDPKVLESIESGRAPFTTIIIDEAGLISRSAVAALSLLASRRVVLAGDPKQLAPISRISRVLPNSQATWLASSGLSHLGHFGVPRPGTCALREQHRMHPHISTLISQYQYDGILKDGAVVRDRPFARPTILDGQPRAIWYVLDEGEDDLPSIRAERGPGNRSWLRRKSRRVLELLFSDEAMRRARGLFITPFVAQAREAREYLAEEEILTWSSATVHSQQGTEADIVIFDPVNAGSTAWPPEEWKRLVNVGVSRAREFVIILASRAEMRAPYLRPLIHNLAPRSLKRSGGSTTWARVTPEVEYEVALGAVDDPARLGSQIAARKTLRPVLSAEQQRLCGYTMDGKPRLVRGVAGSGKTAVMAHWIVKTLRRTSPTADTKIWAVFANNSLSRLISDTIQEVWADDPEAGPYPAHRVELWHIGQLWSQLGVRPLADDRYNYDAAAKAHLAKIAGQFVQPRCHAMFIDEAQDLGPAALEFLGRLVAQSDESNPKTRAINIFYDNAQNVYGRPTPKWSEIGLDMRGRSFVMQESFRSTKPITEFALNVLYRLRPDEKSGDHAELIDRSLIERADRGGQEWWNVRFNQSDGPAPILKRFTTVEAEFEAIGDQLVSWIKTDGVRPNDICVLYNSQPVKLRLEGRVAEKLASIGVALEVQTGQAFSRDPNTVVSSTAQSYKGYESEVVLVAGADMFVAKGTGVLANGLYVAMTRARSLLAVYGLASKAGEGGRVMQALDECVNLLGEPSTEQVSPLDVANDLISTIGTKNREWLKSIMKKSKIELDSVLADNGEVIAEPLFWFVKDGVPFACFVGEPLQAIRHKLEDLGFQVIAPGHNMD